MSQGHLFTSESVAAGHPDKLCDNISDAILDACLSVDPSARVAVETLVKALDDGSHIIIAGEVSIHGGQTVDYEAIARKTASEIGYTSHDYGMCANDSESCKVQLFLSSQSEDISQGVTEGEGMFESQGAGDQGLMFGYATDESESWDELKGFYMPLPILLSQRLTMALSAAGLNGTLEWARPDAKSQVTVEYSEEGKPIRCETIVVAIQHDDLLGMFDGDESKEQQYFQSQVVEHIINKVIPSQLMDEQTNVIVNGTGRFEKGGPHADAGLTGRKIIVDTYGGMGRHGGGAFSGKDPSKVDRSAAYASRWAAKHIIAAGLAQRCEIQLAYAIGVAEPISIKVETFGTGNISDSEISERLSKAFDFRPAVIISELGLLKPIFKRTAAGGHFGRVPEDDGGFSWEALDQTKIAILQNQ